MKIKIIPPSAPLIYAHKIPLRGRNTIECTGPECSLCKSTAIFILTNARWHCLYGSKPIDRTPDAGDLGAAVILDRLLKELKGK